MSLSDKLKEGGLADRYKEISKVIDEQPKDGEEIVEIDPSRVDPNPFQYRIRFDAEWVRELGVRIRKNGQMQPIGVRKAGDRFQIIWGEHRWRACRQEGVKVKAIIREATDGEMADLCFAENHDRTNPSAYEDYNAILIQKNMGKSAKEIQESLGVRPQDYYKLLSFENFPPSVIEIIKENLDIVGKTEAEALGKICNTPDIDMKKFSDVVCEGIERVATGNLPSRKAMIAFIQKELKTSGAPTKRKNSAKSEDNPSSELYFEGKSVGTFMTTETELKVSVSKEDLPQDKFDEFQKYVKNFFEVVGK